MTPREGVPSREEIAGWIKERREAAGLTQYAAAQAIGTTVTSISRWETATHPLGLEEAIALLLLYDAIEELPHFVLTKRRAKRR